MPSIVDMIARTEAEADAIRTEAAQKAKSIIADSTAEAEAEVAAAQERVRKDIVLRRENANHTAEKLRQDILAAKSKETQHKCQLAQGNVDKAAKFIIERLSV